MDAGTIWKRVLQASILLVIIVAVAGFCLWLEPNRVYEDTVDGHLENARTAATPEEMKEEIELAIAGTHNLDMEDDDYGAWFPWFKTEQVRVGYQREQLENITVRLDDLIAWHHRMNTHGEGFQEMKDVYNKKLVNIRDYLDVEQSGDEGDTPSEILEHAWFAKEHPFVYMAPVILMLLLSFILCWVVALMPLDMKYDII